MTNRYEVDRTFGYNVEGRLVRLEVTVKRQLDINFIGPNADIRAEGFHHLPTMRLYRHDECLRVTEEGIARTDDILTSPDLEVSSLSLKYQAPTRVTINVCALPEENHNGDNDNEN